MKIQMNHRTNRLISSLNSLGGILPVEKSLNLVVKLPKTTVMSGKAAPDTMAHAIEMQYIVHVNKFAYRNTFYATLSAQG